MNKDGVNFNKKTILSIMGIIVFTILVIFAFFNFEKFLIAVNIISSAIAPFITGLIIAYILNHIVNLYEKYIFCYFNKKFRNGKIWNKINRGISILMAYVTVIVVICLILLFIIPELSSSIKQFAITIEKTVPVYIKDLSTWIENFIIENNLNINIKEIQDAFFKNFDLSNIVQGLTHATSDIFIKLANATIGVASGIFTAIVSLIFSIYFLSSKEKLVLTGKKVLYSYTPRRHANRISMFLSLSNRVFSNYVRGQLTECLILGTLCYIGMSIIGLDYALMISTIVTICAFIPLVGAFIGAGAGAFILLLVNPIEAVWFLIFFVILQQFEGNVIFPRVVGSSLGLPGIWTLAAVTIMGGIFGIAGILIGTPVAGVAYTLIKNNANQRLQKREIGIDVLEGSEVAIIYKDILHPEPKNPKAKKNSVSSALKRKREQLSSKK